MTRSSRTVALVLALLATPLFAAESQLRVRPSVFATGGGSFWLDAPDVAPCIGPLCRTPQLVIDGVAVDLVPARSGSREMLAGVAPPHAPGAVDVTFIPARPDAAPITVAGALHYFDGSAPVDLAIFEPVYFPVTYSGPGVYGSEWETRIAFFTPLLPARTFGRGDLQAGFTGGLQVPSSAEGFLLYVERGEADAVRWSARAYERSRGNDAGVEVPVVHERATGPVQYVLDVPFVRGHRALLRIAGVDRVERDVELRVYIEPNGTPAIRTIHLRAPERMDQPSFATVDLYAEWPQLLGHTSRLHVTSTDPAARLFAFVIVTDNATQQVTIVRPQ